MSRICTLLFPYIYLSNSEHLFFIGIDKKIPINNSDMAHSNPLRAILNARQALTDALARIHVYFDRSGIPMPGNIANRFDEATRASNAIIQHVNDARMQRERLDQMHAEA